MNKKINSERKQEQTQNKEMKTSKTFRVGGSGWKIEMI